eukprot:2680775-Karenia_brevis.AAC.1
MKWRFGKRRNRNAVAIMTYAATAHLHASRDGRAEAHHIELKALLSPVTETWRHTLQLLTFSQAEMATLKLI